MTYLPGSTSLPLLMQSVSKTPLESEAPQISADFALDLGINPQMQILVAVPGLQAVLPAQGASRLPILDAGDFRTGNAVLIAPPDDSQVEDILAVPATVDPVATPAIKATPEKEAAPLDVTAFEVMLGLSLPPLPPPADIAVPITVRSSAKDTLAASDQPVAHVYDATTAMAPAGPTIFVADTTSAAPMGGAASAVPPGGPQPVPLQPMPPYPALSPKPLASDAAMPVPPEVSPPPVAPVREAPDRAALPLPRVSAPLQEESARHQDKDLGVQKPPRDDPTPEKLEFREIDPAQKAPATSFSPQPTLMYPTLMSRSDTTQPSDIPPRFAPAPAAPMGRGEASDPPRPDGAKPDGRALSHDRPPQPKPEVWSAPPVAMASGQAGLGVTLFETTLSRVQTDQGERTAFVQHDAVADPALAVADAQATRPASGPDRPPDFRVDPSAPTAFQTERSSLPAEQRKDSDTGTAPPDPMPGVAAEVRKAERPEVQASPTTAPAYRHPATQVADAILTRKHDQIELRLSPDELGGLRIELRRHGDTMLVAVSAERPETVDLMRRHADQLAADLKSGGFQGVNISFGRWSGHGAASANPNQAGNQGEQPPSPAPGENPGNSAPVIPAWAARSGLYLRI